MFPALTESRGDKNLRYWERAEAKAMAGYGPPVLGRPVVLLEEVALKLDETFCAQVSLWTGKANTRVVLDFLKTAEVQTA